MYFFIQFLKCYLLNVIKYYNHWPRQLWDTGARAPLTSNCLIVLEILMEQLQQLLSRTAHCENFKFRLDTIEGEKFFGILVGGKGTKGSKLWIFCSFSTY